MPVATAEPTLVGARVYTATGQPLGTVRAVEDATVLVASAQSPAGIWLSLDRIQLVVGGRIYLTPA
jgi:hypothetical protein